MSEVPPLTPTQARRRALLNLAGTVPYGAGSRLLAWVLGNPLIQRTLFRGRIHQLRRVGAAIGRLPGELRAEDVTRHLMVSRTVPWRVNALSRCDDATFRRWVRVEGAQVLYDLKAAGRSALLVNCHTGMARLVPLVLQRIGLDAAVIEPESFLALMGARGAERIRSIVLRGEGEQFWMKELYQANKILGAGGMVTLALDGHQGRAGVEHAFLGRSRVFHVSLARLAIETQAAIVLIRVVMDEAGRVLVRFTGPLDMGDASLSPEARLRRFLDQYVTQIEEVWRTDLGNVSPRHFRPYLQSEPFADPAVTRVPAREGAAA